MKTSDNLQGKSDDKTSSVAEKCVFNHFCTQENFEDCAKKQAVIQGMRYNNNGRIFLAACPKQKVFVN